MKKIVLFLLVTLVFMVKALSQNMEDKFQKSDNCFTAVKAGMKPNASLLSETFCIGDKITVKLRGNKIIRGRIDELSQNYIVTADGSEIDVSKIKWIKKPELTDSRKVVGALVTAAGAILVIHASTADIDSDKIAAQGGLGIFLVTTGIVILTNHTKFNIEKEDKLIFKNQD